MPQFLTYRDERKYKPFRQSIRMIIKPDQSVTQDHLDLDDCYTVVGFQVPGNWTAANIAPMTVHPCVIGAPDSAQNAIPGSSFVVMNEPDSADDVEFQVTAGEYTYIDPSILAGCRFLKFRSQTDGTPVPQASQNGEGASEDRELWVIVRPV